MNSDSVICLASLSNYCQYHILGIINNRIVPILIDTGASWSHISASFLKNHQIKNCEEKSVRRFDGTTKKLNKKTLIEIDLSGIQNVKLELYVDEEPNKILLGTDFLENFCFKIESDCLFLNQNQHPRFKLHEDKIFEIIQDLTIPNGI